MDLKEQDQEFFRDWNCDFLRSSEPEPKKSHSFKKRVYDIIYNNLIYCDLLS